VAPGQFAQRVTRALHRRLDGISYRRVPSFTHPVSQGCTYAQMRSPEYRRWCEVLRIPDVAHRKLWEWCYILQVLTRAGMAAPGRRGVGFGVGIEPVTAFLAGRGCTVLATDLPTEAAVAAGWTATNQHATRLEDLDANQLCPPEDFRARVSFAEMDMNAIPADLGGFDFAWSSCALEHLGDLDAGLRFFDRAIECLVPGGVGVHTTEYNVSSDDATMEAGHSVLYRRRDLEALVRRTRAKGHDMRITFALGDAPQDLHVDLAPYSDVHIRTKSEGFVHTSFGLIVRRSRPSRRSRRSRRS
jgi:hypothetical protein